MKGLNLRLAGGACALAVAALAGSAAPGLAAPPQPVQHVLLLSVDGMHQSDLEWYASEHPGSALARLARHGAEFTRARAPFPSDSFPGMTALVTGGNPRSTGVYYDDSWNRALLPAGTTDCAHAVPGAEVTYFEQADLNQDRLDAGYGLADPVRDILQLTPVASRLIDSAQLPVDPSTCAPVYPHQYIQTNTVFEVARARGLRTAWSDKHPAYDLVGGRSQGVQDFFTPEINSQVPGKQGADWTKDNRDTQTYDDFKVQAVLNEINGYDHSGRNQVGTPAIFGMNFQSVSTAQKLLRSGGQNGGYVSQGGALVPGPVLSDALGFVDRELSRMTDAIARNHLEHSTVITITAKHGQSPIDPAQLTRIDDGPVTDALNTAWSHDHPERAQPLMAFSINDDGMLMWLNDRSELAAAYAKSFLLGYSGSNGRGYDGQPKSYTQAGLASVYAGQAAAAHFQVAPGDARVPDLVGVAQVGTVYTHGSKIAEHGGANPADRDVLLIVSGATIKHSVSSAPFETTSVAPTILSLLGLSPASLHSVQVEGTPVLPLDRAPDRP